MGDFVAGRTNRGTTFPDEAIAKKTRENTQVGFFSYPNDLGPHSFIMNFVKFKMGYQSSPTDDIIASIALPLPGQGIVDKSAVKYNQDELGVVGGAIAGAVSKIKTAVDNKGNLAVGNVSGGEEGSGMMDLLKASIQGTAATGRAAINELGQGFGAAADQAFGNVVNPHVVLLFKNVDLKTFSLQWKLAPSNPSESKRLRSLIRLIQKMSHPEQKSEGNSANFFLNYPNQVDIYYAGVQENLHYFKRCAITDVEVNYQPEGDNLFFAGTGAPTRIDLTLGFQETEIWTAEDYADKDMPGQDKAPGGGVG